MTYDLVKRMREAAERSTTRLNRSHIVVEAADRIEQLVKERDEAEKNETLCSNMAVNYLERAEVAEAKLAKAAAALRWVVNAKGLTDPTEYGYSAIKHARSVLAELEKTE
jgi:hypothetical protein